MTITRFKSSFLNPLKNQHMNGEHLMSAKAIQGCEEAINPW
jgi:hypothetical protein